ncbi:hypothetical protein MML48_1g15798 [Holotrichia oblita]|uniref:Uncharacterized protein n=1 Tax=Holotrichia oblita TaxID=644536 RepID=A0ACB9TXV5_HOLOL|nr:hypothetical protein MML48_1g15798 [Holotrichia oblita]
MSALKTPSREDLTKPSQKYINSRFLPKNTVEKSYTAYTRTSSARTNEVSRKNRELLNVLSTQNDDRSRPTSRCSSTTQDDIKERYNKNEIPTISYHDLETITVVTRSTSPNLPNQNSIPRSKRIDNARTIEKQISRAKLRPESSDKEVQSDRLDDSTKSSRFAGASRIATYLDLKYSSPENQDKSGDTDESIPNKKDLDSPKSLSRNSSSKSLTYTSTKSESSKENKNTKSDKLKSKLTPPRSTNQSDSKKQLPPQVPKSDSPNRSLHPLTTTNKDFRKSVLNMSTDGKLRKKSSKRSNSVSSADSDGTTSEATEVSENLSSCIASYPKSSSVSKLPQKIAQDDQQRSRRSCTRSPTVGSESSSATTSSSEDDNKSKAPNTISSVTSATSAEHKLKKLNLALARGSASISSPDDPEKPSKPPLSPRIKPEGPKTEAEAKSFLMRALAPVTNLFKATRQDSSEDKLNWLDNTCDNISEIKTDSLSSNLKSLSDSDQKIQKTKIEICMVEPEKQPPKEYPVKLIRHVDSDDIPWWLQDEPEIPEGVEVWPATSITPEALTEDKRVIYKVKNDDDSSSEIWWFEETEESRSLSAQSPKCKLKLLKHIDSGEKAWWLDEDAEIPEGVQVIPDPLWKLKSMKHVGSGEKAWWLDENAEAPEGVEVFQEAPITAKDEESCENDKIKLKKSFWIGSSENDSLEEPEFLKKYKIRHIDSGERAWWMSSSENLADDSRYHDKDIPLSKPKHYEESDDESECQAPLGDRASPEGLETPKEDEDRGRISPYDNIPSSKHKVKNMERVKLFISKHTNIDDVLGGSSQLLSPIMSRIFGYDDHGGRNEEVCEEINPGQVRIHDGTPQRGVIQPTRL